MEEKVKYEVNIDKVVKIPIDLDTKSILIIHDFTGTPDELQVVYDNLGKWLNSDDPLFVLVTRGNTRIEIRKVGKRGKR